MIKQQEVTKKEFLERMQAGKLKAKADREKNKAEALKLFGQIVLGDEVEFPAGKYGVAKLKVTEEFTYFNIGKDAFALIEKKEIEGDDIQVGSHVLLYQNGKLIYSEEDFYDDQRKKRGWSEERLFRLHELREPITDEQVV